jgi:exopolysaccharide production protein ExoQ
MECSIEELVTTGLLLLFLTHFFIPILQPVESSLFSAASQDQTMLGQCINLAVWAIAGALMFRSHRAIASRWREVGWTVAFSALTLASAAWSQDFILTTLFGIYFARRYTMERQMQLICVAGLIAALLSIFFALLLPKYGIDHDVHEGVWLGIFTQKNVCAREMLFLLATVLPYRPRRSGLKACRIAAIFGIVAVIVGTQSKTALLIMAVVVLLFPALVLVRRVSRSLLLVAGASALGVAVVGWVLEASALPQLIALLGRDSTMTGRTEIWQAVLQAIMKHPLLGYGFAAFWLSLRGESANIIVALRWAVPAAHNGFLEIWLQLGAAGLFLFAAGFLFALRSALRGLRQPSFSRAAWPLAVILLLTVVYNLDESSLMQPNDFLWMLYVATLVNLAVPSRTTQRFYMLGQPLPAS